MLRSSFMLGALLLATVLPGCGNDTASIPLSPSPWDLTQPTTSVTLPAILSEISGLTLLDSTQIGAIQDESGTLFVIDAKTGAVARQAAFGRPADYEGLERVGDRLYVLQSNGRLLELTGWREHEEIQAEEVNRSLPAGCDAEGLGYDGASRLLIACKSGGGGGDRYYRVVYAYDINAGQLAPEPAFVLNSSDIIRNPHYDSAVNRAMRLLAERFTDLSGFTPSAIAVDEGSGRIYMLSSTRKAFLMLDPDGRLLDVWPLPNDLFPQPEGLALGPDSTLYISNEGPSGSGTLLTFTPQ